VQLQCCLCDSRDEPSHRCLRAAHSAFPCARLPCTSTRPSIASSSRSIVTSRGNRLSERSTPCAASILCRSPLSCSVRRTVSKSICTRHWSGLTDGASPIAVKNEVSLSLLFWRITFKRGVAVLGHFAALHLLGVAFRPISQGSLARPSACWRNASEKKRDDRGFHKRFRPSFNSIYVPQGSVRKASEMPSSGRLV
jgi:hypothetical protein